MVIGIHGIGQTSWHLLQREKRHPDGPNARGRDGTPALQLAVASAQPKMIKRLVKLKTNVNAICKLGLSALDFAVSHKDVRAASLLVSLRADVSCARTRRAMEMISIGQACTLNDALIKSVWPALSRGARQSGKGFGKGRLGPSKCGGDQRALSLFLNACPIP